MTSPEFSCQDCVLHGKAESARIELDAYHENIQKLDTEIESLKWWGVVIKKATLLRQRQQEVKAANAVQNVLYVIDSCPGPLDNPLVFPTSDTSADVIIRCGVEPDQTTAFKIPR